MRRLVPNNGHRPAIHQQTRPIANTYAASLAAVPAVSAVYGHFEPSSSKPLRLL
jgi:hypothetical protein